MSSMDEAYAESQQRIAAAQKVMRSSTDPEAIAVARRIRDHEMAVWN